jgi:hypothetical protein
MIPRVTKTYGRNPDQYRILIEIVLWQCYSVTGSYLEAYP